MGTTKHGETADFRASYAEPGGDTDTPRSVTRNPLPKPEAKLETRPDTSSE